MTSPHQILHPEGWAPARGYANGMFAAEGRLIALAGLIGWNADQVFEHDDLVGQFRQTLENIVAVLGEAGAAPHHLIRLTWYITDRGDYLASLKAIGAIYREVIGPHYPAMAVVQVVGLMEAKAKIEIEATAVVPTSAAS